VTDYGIAYYDPGLNVKRAEFCKLVVYAFGLESDGVSENNFEDIQGHWAENVIKAAASCGVVNGISSTEFDPEGFITREQMCAMLVRALKYKGIGETWDPAGTEGKLLFFTDSGSISGWAREDAAFALDYGLIQGMEEGGNIKFKPEDHANRAQAAVVIYRSLQLFN